MRRRPQRWERDKEPATRRPTYDPYKIERGGQVSAPNAKEPPIRTSVPAAPPPSSTDGWVRRSSPDSGHECAPPMHEVTYRLPSASLDPNAQGSTDTCTEVNGALGDLWRCDCRKLWRVGDACDLCDIGRDYHDGLCAFGRKWRPATWWQRLRYRDRP